MEYFDEAVGLDFSKAFIKAANHVLETDHHMKKSEVKFVVGDACNLDPALGKFNFIFGGNLIDRLPDPTNFLTSIKNFILPEGILMLASPYSWLEEYTPQSKWVGGYFEEGKPVTTHDGLKRILGKEGFTEIKDSENIRFVIKENFWIYQYTVSNATFWQKD